MYHEFFPDYSRILHINVTLQSRVMRNKFCCGLGVRAARAGSIGVIGPNDLSLSLGISGEPKHPRMVEAYERVIAACRQHGVAPGVHLMDMGWAEEWIAKGMRFLTYYTDIRPAGRRRERYPPASGEPGPEEIAGESKSQTKSRIKASGRAGSRV